MHIQKKKKNPKRWKLVAKIQFNKAKPPPPTNGQTKRVQTKPTPLHNNHDQLN